MRQSEGKGAFIISKRCHEVVAYSWPGHFSKLVEAFKACLDSFTNGSTWPAQSNLKENRFKTISRPRLVLMLIAHAATLAENGIMLRGSAVGDYLYLYLYLYLHLSLSLSPSLSLSTYLSIYIYIYYRYICIYIYIIYIYIYIHTCMNMQHADILHVNSRGLDWDKQKTL